MGENIGYDEILISDNSSDTCSFNITKEEARNIICEHMKESRLRKIIRNTSIVAWGQAINDSDVDRWLTNFNGEFLEDVDCEKCLALWLLKHFTFYTKNDIHILCKVAFNQLIHTKLLENATRKPEEIVAELYRDTLYMGLGNESESGKSMLYYFRQENKLPKTCFIYDSSKKYTNVVYFDDVTMSGTQAIDYIELKRINASSTYACFLFATDDAVNKIKKAKQDIEVISSISLDERDRAFFPNSYVFSDKNIRELRSIAEEFCLFYGKKAVEGMGDYMENNPLGFANGQYLLGFDYNTPDNTLPIFWGQGSGWIPLFKRYHKIYTNGKESAIDGRKYY